MRSIGLSADWSLAYSTIDDRCVRISQRGFLDLWAKGEAYLKEAPTLWCTQCGTALAQADLEFVDKGAQFTTLRFDLVGGGALEIATTRPELLPACACVFVHPSHPRAKELVGREALVPLQGRAVPVLADEKVDPEKGTGMVMCCTFGDKTDVEWFKAHGLPLRTAIGPDGMMTALAGPEQGLFVTKARKAILARLAEAGHVTAQKDVVHPVAVHERCKTDIQFMPTKQVFVRVLDKKADLIAAGEKIRWLPEYMGKRFRNWVENLEWDWCISRQRFYGVPFPFWHCEACGTVKVAEDAQLPIDPTATAPTTPCASCGGTRFRGERDVMDTWATSSETPQINARWGDPAGPARSPLPLSMRPQAHEIIRTWAFYTITKSWLHHRAIPWETAMISGLMLDPNREKISKSKGNNPADPKLLLGRHGADALRYWALSARLGTDYPWNEEDMASGRRLAMKLWNASKLVLGHLADHDPAAPRVLDPVDAGVLERLAATVADATELLDAYEFGLAKKRIEEFFWNDLCDNWLEMAKDRLYEQDPAKASARAGAQATAAALLRGTLRLLSPFVPHVVEAIHQAGLRERDGVPVLARAAWPTGPRPTADGPHLLAWDTAVRALAAVRRWRSEHKVSPGKALGRVRFLLPDADAGRFPAVAGAVRSAGRVLAMETAGATAGATEVGVEVLEGPVAPTA
jgi:valyl-tRNA synthetase